MGKQRTIDIAVAYPKLKFKKTAVKDVIFALDTSAAFNAPKGDLSIGFLTDQELTQVHDDFLDDPTATDVITFIGDEAMNFAGEILISVDRALEIGKEHNQSLSSELTLYLVHGYLHLAGFLDKTEEEKKAMRTAEAQAMAILEKAGALPHFEIK